MELLDQTNLLEEEILKKFNSEINSILRITRSFERTPSVNEFDHIFPCASPVPDQLSILTVSIKKNILVFIKIITIIILFLDQHSLWRGRKKNLPSTLTEGCDPFIGLYEVRSTQETEIS